MVKSALTVYGGSLAVRRSRYVPAPGNVAVVDGAAALANVTPAGPLTCVHALVEVPVSTTEPASAAELTGSWIVWLLPADTCGGGRVSAFHTSDTWFEYAPMPLSDADACTLSLPVWVPV